MKMMKQLIHVCINVCYALFMSREQLRPESHDIKTFTGHENGCQPEITQMPIASANEVAQLIR